LIVVVLIYAYGFNKTSVLALTFCMLWKTSSMVLKPLFDKFVLHSFMPRPTVNMKFMILYDENKLHVAKLLTKRSERFSSSI